MAVTAALISPAIVCNISSATDASTSVPSATSFKDVPTSHWAYSSILEVASKGLITGYSDGTFRPASNVTRAEFASILARAFDGNERVKTTFKDVPTTHWAYDAINEGVALGFINPSDYSSGQFEPNKPMTRAEISKWLTGSLKATNSQYAEIEKTIRNSELTLLPIAEFTKGTLPKNDVGTVGVMVGTGLLSGYTDGTFKPSGNTNRAEVASIILRYLNVSKKNPTDFRELNELLEVAETGTNFHTMGGVFVNEDKGRNWETLKKETHLMRNGNGTIRVNRMILVDTRDRTNFKGIYKELFNQMAKVSTNMTQYSSMFIAVEHAYKPIKSTPNADWYTKISPSHSLLSSMPTYKDSRFNLPTSDTYRTAWKFDKNGEQLMWHGTMMLDRTNNGRALLQHITSEKDYTMIINK